MHCCAMHRKLEAYFIMALLPLAESKGIQNKAYADAAKGIFSKMAL